MRKGATRALWAVGAPVALLAALAGGSVAADDPADEPPVTTPDTSPDVDAEPVVEIEAPPAPEVTVAVTVPAACADGDSIDLGDGVQGVCVNGDYVAQATAPVPVPVPVAAPPATAVVDDVEVGVGPAPVPATSQIARPAPTVPAPVEPEYMVDEVAAEIVVVDVVLAAWG